MIRCERHEGTTARQLNEHIVYPVYVTILIKIFAGVKQRRYKPFSFIFHFVHLYSHHLSQVSMYVKNVKVKKLKLCVEPT